VVDSCTNGAAGALLHPVCLVSSLAGFLSIAVSPCLEPLALAVAFRTLLEGGEEVIRCSFRSPFPSFLVLVFVSIFTYIEVKRPRVGLLRQFDVLSVTLLLLLLLPHLSFS
jgi:hypothetical protein